MLGDIHLDTPVPYISIRPREDRELIRYAFKHEGKATLKQCGFILFVKWRELILISILSLKSVPSSTRITGFGAMTSQAIDICLG